MSKTQLKKTLALMTAEQIAEMVIELYDARPEAKEYLDFFVSPDIDKKLERAKMLISKEMKRSSRGRNRARSTKLKRFIKDISSLNPGPEAVAEIMTFTVETFCAVGSDQLIKVSTQGALARMLHDTVVYIDTTGQLSEYLPRIRKAVDAMKSPWFRGNEFKKLLKEELKETLESL